ncbi:MAG: hypothetical protein PHP17_00645 [Candidatus Omnitrophica bacterium]|nr:hypothetical protein [Candidatus Omnitrophota bacterium]
MKTVLGIMFALAVFYVFPAQSAEYSDMYSQNDIGYDKFFALQDDYKLVLKDNDIYVYNIEGVSKRRITHTPKINKAMATFSKDRGYIIYGEYATEGATGGDVKYYRVKFDNDDNTRSLISKEEYDALSQK